VRASLSRTTALSSGRLVRACEGGFGILYRTWDRRTEACGQRCRNFDLTVGFLEGDVEIFFDVLCDNTRWW